MSEQRSPTHRPSSEDFDPAEELAELMREDSDTEDAAPGPALPSLPLPSGPLTGGSLTMSRTNDMRQARRLGIRFGLAPYAVKELEDFATENQNQRALLSQAKLLVIEAKIALLIAPAGTYEVPTPLMDNIVSYVLAVLLSPKLSSYKGIILIDKVMAVLKRLNVNMPPNLDTNRHMYKTVKEAISNELTQCRSKIKKAIAASRKSNQTIWSLANTLTDDTQCSVTVALCARLALLRKIHAEPNKSGHKFWDHVNERLELMRSTAKGDSDGLQCAVTRILDKDCHTYGDATNSPTPEYITNTVQATIDNLLGENESTEPGPSSTSTQPGEPVEVEA